MSRASAKYAPLEGYLRAQSGVRVLLTFAEIEALIGAPLPASAYSRWWWGNLAAKLHSRAWLDAGWRVASVDIPNRVTFTRREAGA